MQGPARHLSEDLPQSSSPPGDPLQGVRRQLSTLDPEGIPLLPALSTRLPTLTLNDRLTLHLGHVTMEIVHRQAHTPNSLMVYLPEQKILFSGDIVCSGGLPAFQEALVLPWLKTLETVMDMDLQWVVPGHGDICTKEGVKRFRGQIEDLLRTVQKEMDRGISKDDIVDQIRFPDHVHVTTDSYQGYPQDMLENFQRVSISNIYDQLSHRTG